MRERRWAGGMLRVVALELILLLALAGGAGAAVRWDSEALLNVYGAGDFYPDSSPRVATDGAGNWVAVWEFADLSDRDIVTATSANGSSWTGAAYLNADALIDASAFDVFPDIATDGQGTWVAVWSSRRDPVEGATSADYDILCARSTNNGASWSAPVRVNSGGVEDAADDYFARLACDGEGNWVVVWNARASDGSEQRLLSARSANGGVSWEAEVEVSNEPLTLGETLVQPRIATDRAGNWMVAACSDQVLSASTGADFDLFGWTSSNHGAGWSAPFAINASAAADSAVDGMCDLATDGNGTWLAAWESTHGTIDGGFDVYMARSQNLGVVWSNEQAVNSTRSQPDVADSAPVIAHRGAGSWVVGWHTTLHGGTDIRCTASNNGGVTWEAEGGPVNTTAEAALGGNLLGSLVGDGQGDLLAVWQSTDTPLSGESEPDIFFARGLYFKSAETLMENDHSTGEMGSGEGAYASLGFALESFAWPEYREDLGAYLAHVAADEATPHRFRVAGVFSMPEDWLPYQSVGAGNYVRVKYAIYAGGQEDPEALDTIPNLRIRAAVRFAQNAILDVYNHINADPGGLPYGQELRPSRDPENPSIYRVDLDPVDVPYLANNGAAEGIMRGFEAYSTDPQDNGFLAMTESSIAVYPSLLNGAGEPVKVYAPGAEGAGDLASVSAGDSTRAVYFIPTETGQFPVADESMTTAVVISEGSFGVTLDTTDVPADRLGIASREFLPGNDPEGADYVRVEADKQYVIRYHLTSTQSASLNAQVRCRARTVKWNWVQRFEIGGAWAAGEVNNAIAQQSLPGVGCLNPDNEGGENGGWYTLVMNSPLSPDIRPETGGPLEAKMPLLASEPGPGESGYSFRDLKVGLDLLDTISPGALSALEQGNVTVDRIEVYAVRAVTD